MHMVQTWVRLKSRGNIAQTHDNNKYASSWQQIRKLMATNTWQQAHGNKRITTSAFNKCIPAHNNKSIPLITVGISPVIVPEDQLHSGTCDWASLHRHRHYRHPGKDPSSLLCPILVIFRRIVVNIFWVLPPIQSYLISTCFPAYVPKSSCGSHNPSFFLVRSQIRTDIRPRSCHRIESLGISLSADPFSH